MVGAIVSPDVMHALNSSTNPGKTVRLAYAARMYYLLLVILFTPPMVHANSFSHQPELLNELERGADLIFKGQVISSTALTNNTSFPYWGKAHATRFRLMSVLKGNIGTNEIVFWHNTSGPDGWGGGTPPSWHHFVAGDSYLVFAANLEKPDYLYTAPSDAASRTNEFRQLRNDGVMRTLDSRPVTTTSLKEIHWLELNRMLASSDPTNVLYAIRQLNALSESCLAAWQHNSEFNREAVLKAILPLVTNANDEITVASIGCFQVGGNTGTFVPDLGVGLPILRGSSEVKPECVAQVAPYATILVAVATDSPSVKRRIAAVAAFSCTGFSVVSNSLPRWLRDPDEGVRVQAVLLLPDFPGESSDRALRDCAADASPRVRAAVADAIGNGQRATQLPTLVKLFSDPVGLSQPLPPMTIEGLESGGRCFDVSGDVHTSAGYALLKFDLSQVSDILKTNLSDRGFRLQFLCKLAEEDPAPWINYLAEIMEARRARNTKRAEAGGVPIKHLYGAYYECWKRIYDYLKNQTYADFGNGTCDRYIAVLEQAGNTGSQEPVLIYELFKMKGLNKRAAKYRIELEKEYATYHISEILDKVDARYPNNGAIPDQ